MPLDLTKIPVLKTDNDGPFTDDFVRHMVVIAQTQHGIIKYAEAMAQVLAEAGRASHKATGDSPQTAVCKWLRVIEERAMALLREQKALERPTIEE